MRAACRWLPTVSGLVLTASGAYLPYYWVSDLRDPAGASPVTTAVGRLQTGLTTAVGADPVRSALVLGVVVLAAVRGRRPAPPEPTARPLVHARPGPVGLATRATSPEGGPDS